MKQAALPEAVGPQPNPGSPKQKQRIMSILYLSLRHWCCPASGFEVGDGIFQGLGCILLQIESYSISSPGSPSPLCVLGLHLHVDVSKFFITNPSECLQPDRQTYRCVCIYFDSVLVDNFNNRNQECRVAKVHLC